MGCVHVKDGLANFVCSAGRKINLKNYKPEIKVQSSVGVFSNEIAITAITSIIFLGLLICYSNASSKNRPHNYKLKDEEAKRLYSYIDDLSNPFHLLAFFKRPVEMGNFVSDTIWNISDSIWGINEKDDHGNTPLHWAVIHPSLSGTGTIKKVQEWLNEQKSKSFSSKYGGDEIKKWSAEITKPSGLNLFSDDNPTIETIKILLENGADISIKNDAGQTPLEFASLGDNFFYLQRNILKTLIDAGADKTIKDKRGKTLLDYDIKLIQVDASIQKTIPDFVDDSYEEDESFPQFICPISGSLIRFPMLDPTDGRTLYEKKSIVEWVKTKPTSPVTKKTLHERQLLATPNIQKYIEKFLATKIKTLPNKEKIEINKNDKNAEGLTFIKKKGFLN